jgi:rod shape-determining protein MreC
MAGLGWRLTRGRGAKQFSLIACAVSALVIALVGKADGAIFDSARAALSDWTAPVLGQVRAPLVGFERWFGNLGTIFTVYRENTELRRENAELHKWQDVALSLESRLERYEHLLNVVPDPKLPFITARVIGEASRPFVRTMILNAGTAQQVKKGQAVVDDRGLLGRIYVTGEHTAWVILLTDLNSRVPVVIESSHRRAILVGDNTPAPQLELDVGDGPIKAGDRVLSTGDGGLLPPDVPVGMVMGEGDAVRVALFAAPGTSDFVHVIDYHMAEPPPAIDSVPGAASPNAAASSQAKNNPAKVATVVAVKPPPAAKPLPLQSQDPVQPQFDGQNEEQDR